MLVFLLGFLVTFMSETYLMKTYRIVIEYWTPNEFGQLYNEQFIQTRSSCGKIADDYLAQDRTDSIRSVEVTPV